MSVGVLKIERDKIVLAADNQVTYGNMYKVSSGGLNNQPVKIMQNENVAFATAGTPDIGILFFVYSKNHKLVHNDVDGIISYMVDFDKWLKEHDSSLKQSNSFLLVADKKCYEIDGFAVRQISDYCTIGSGTFLALGALYMGADASKAVEVAKLYDLFCGGETHVIEIPIN